MCDLDFSGFKRWKFSAEATKLAEELNIFQENKESELPDSWRLLLHYVTPSEEREKTEEDVECLTDSSISTDVDEEEWEDLKVYMKECENSRNLFQNRDKENEENERCNSFNKLSIDDDKNDEAVKVKNKIFKKRTHNYNVLSQAMCTQEYNEDEDDDDIESDTVSLLKSALTKEDTDVEEIAELLKSPDVTKQHVADLWVELESYSSSRLCLCSVMADHKLRVIFMNQKLLLPWLLDSRTDHLNELVRKIAILIPKFSETAVKYLITPLVTNASGNDTSNPFLKDTYLLQDIMSRLGEQHWMMLLKELLDKEMKTDKYQLMLLKVVIENTVDLIAADENVIYKLLCSINSVMNDYSKDREFGLLISTTVDCIVKSTHVSPAIVKSLENIADNYKGPMRFKIGSSIKKICK